MKKILAPRSNAEAVYPVAISSSMSTNSLTIMLIPVDTTTSESPILMPKTDRHSWVFDNENRLRFNITSNVSLLFILEFWQDENISGTQRRYQTLLRFSKFM